MLQCVFLVQHIVPRSIGGIDFFSPSLPVLVFEVQVQLLA